MLSFTCGDREQLFHKRQIRLSLIRHLRSILSSEAGIMLNSIVLAQLRKIESVSPIRAAQEVGRELGHEKAERGREVECLAHGGVQVAEGDVLAVVGENAMVCPGGSQRAGGAACLQTHIALSMGHAERESPSRGATYSGHLPAWPGSPAAMTLLGG